MFVPIFLIFITIMIGVVTFIIDRPGKSLIRAKGMNPDNTLGIRTRPMSLNKGRSNEYALIEFYQGDKVRFYIPSHKQFFEVPASSVMAFGISEGLFGQIQIYLDSKVMNNPQTYVPISGLMSGVIVSPGTVFNNRKKLTQQVRRIAQDFGINITTLQYPSDLKRLTAIRLTYLVAAIIGLIVYNLK